MATCEIITTLSVDDLLYAYQGSGRNGDDVPSIENLKIFIVVPNIQDRVEFDFTYSDECCEEINDSFFASFQNNWVFLTVQAAEFGYPKHFLYIPKK